MLRNDGCRTIKWSRVVAAALAAAGTGCGPAMAGGLLIYEVGTADIGLASAGYGARAQDASTVFTNPAGMTRLDGRQAVGGGQVLWGNPKFSIGQGTSPALGSGDGGYAFGSNGWFLGGGAFASWTVSPDVKFGLAFAGNFGAPLKYDETWVGRYYVQETTMLGLSILPSVAFKVNDRLSLGASLNAMYGIYTNQVAINNIAPGIGDGQLKLDDRRWGWGANLGLLYEVDRNTRLGLTWNSQVNLDFDAAAEFSNLGPALSALLNNRGLLNSRIKVGIKVPQQVMGSFFTQVDDRWAVLGSVGWQQWSRFGQVQLGISDTTNPVSTTTQLNFKDTWHAALGAQYQTTGPWLVSFGVAYDSEFQDGSQVSPLLPVNAAWRFGVGAQQPLGRSASWGVAATYLYGGSLDTNITGSKPVALGGRGDLVGSYDSIGTIFVGAWYAWRF
jgi:long-chain fatty acid transport protein